MKQTKTIMCIGSGGVGKTTVASVFGLHHALKGHKTLVITIDPAKRLLDALGMKADQVVPKRVDVEGLLGKKPKKGGALFAFMPDLEHEWMDFLIASITS